MDELSILIKDVYVVDGSGKPPYKASIGIKGDKVTHVGKVKGDAATEIEGKGLTAIPGFIDSHSHGDFSLLYYPKCESYLFQGVTTMVTGNCGMSPGPIGDKITLPGIAEYYQSELEPYKYEPAHTVYPRETVNKLMKEKFGWTVDWHSMADWFKIVEQKKISMNIATLVGHVTVRRTVMGDDFERPAKKAERDEMESLIRQSLDDGCIGLSVGLDYDPDTFADKEELISACKVAAEYNTIFVPHSRRTGRRKGVTAGQRPRDKIDAINEVINLCRESKVRMNIAHLFTGWYISPGNCPSELEEANRRVTLKVIDNAIAEGLDISFDCLPSCMTSVINGAAFLCGSFEPWVREKGSRAEFSKWLKVEEYRQEIKDAIKAGKWYTREGSNINPHWAEDMTILKHRDRKTINKTLAQIAEEEKKDPYTVWFDLIVEDPDALSGYPFTYPSGPPELNAEYHKVFWQHPASALGIDTDVFDFEYEPPVPIYMLPMIMFYSAFPSFIEKFVKREKILTIEQAVHKTSTQAARRYGLKGRGEIKPGSYADIVLLDMDRLKVNNTPLEPKKKTSGIDYVLVNGSVAIMKGEHTGARQGQVLRRTRQQ